MKYDEMFNKVRNLEFDTEMSVCKSHDTELYLLRPSVLSKRFSTYNVKKNFQIWLRTVARNFRPNHLRVFIDLNLRVRSRPDLKEKMLVAFDDIFYGKDPNEVIQGLKKEKFEHFLNPIEIIANLSQLFIIEQAYSYNKESNFDPPTLFYQGWIRQVLDDIKEIDNLCMSISRGQPAAAKYTSKENKKSNKFQAKLRPLWYIEA
ncbi:MAG: hypothetical protein NTZ93_02580 [Candidatus Beckwithbacteria bacterium]|nr:hypothetical protein [Candidatus Beckwithbacteria bacterium]